MSLAGPVSHRALPGQQFQVPHPRPGSCEFATAAACPGRSGFFTLRYLPQARTELRRRFLSSPARALATWSSECGPRARRNLNMGRTVEALQHGRGWSFAHVPGPPAAAAAMAADNWARHGRVERLRGRRRRRPRPEGGPQSVGRGRHYRLESGGPATNLKAARVRVPVRLGPAPPTAWRGSPRSLHTPTPAFLPHT